MEFRQFIVPFILFIIGGSIYMLGALLKIMHWEVGFFNGSVLLIIASLVDFAAIVLVIIKLLSIYREEKQ